MISVAASIESIGGKLDRSTSASGGFSAAAGGAGFDVPAGSVGGGYVLGSHSYADEGTYTVSVSVYDDGALAAQTTGTATVQAVAVTANNGFT